MEPSIVGVWKLTHLVHVAVDVCESSRPAGLEPYGFIRFTAEGTYLHTVVSQDELFGVHAETGTYRLQPGGRISLHRTSSTNPLHEEDAKVEYQIAGDTLMIAGSRIEEISETEILETFVWKRWPIRIGATTPSLAVVEELSVSHE